MNQNLPMLVMFAVFAVASESAAQCPDVSDLRTRVDRLEQVSQELLEINRRLLAAVEAGNASSASRYSYASYADEEPQIDFEPAEPTATTMVPTGKLQIVTFGDATFRVPIGDHGYAVVGRSAATLRPVAPSSATAGYRTQLATYRRRSGFRGTTADDRRKYRVTHPPMPIARSYYYGQ